jgi:hypothetical protein
MIVIRSPHRKERCDQRGHETTGPGDLFRARLDQIINMKHELVRQRGARAADGDAGGRISQKFVA